MSSGQSLRNGSSVEPGLPKIMLMPNARSRSKVACLTVVALFVSFGDLRDTIVQSSRAVIASEAKQSSLFVALDCFVSLAMTVLPSRGALHGRPAFGVGDPQLHAARRFIGVDGEFAAFEQRLHAAIAEFLWRLAVMQLGGEFDDQRGLQGAVEDQAGIALDLGDVVAVVMDAVAVEGQCRIAKQQH